MDASARDWLDGYLLSKPGALKDFKAEWGWIRYLVGGRMFAAICEPGPQHKAPYAGRALVSLKCEPLKAEFLRAQHEDIAPGFYCDKRCWNSVFLASAVPDGLLREMCDDSYSLVFAKLTRAAWDAITK